MKKISIISILIVVFVIVGNALAVNFSSDVSIIDFGIRSVNEPSVILLFGAGLIAVASTIRNRMTKD